MRFGIVFVCVVALSLFAGVWAHIAHNGSDVAKIADWVRNTGRDGYVAGDVAKALGFSSAADVSSRGKVFADPNKLASYSAVVAGSDIVISRQSRERNIFWLIKNDEIQRTLVTTDGLKLDAVPNDTYSAEWTEAKDFLLRKAAEQ